MHDAPWVVSNPEWLLWADRVLYQTYQMYADFIGPVQFLARTATRLFGQAYAPFYPEDLMRGLGAGWQLIGVSRLSHKRPEFGIKTIKVDGQETGVRETTVHSRPFGRLVHFEKDVAVVQPRALLVAPMSGHFATLMRDAVRALLQDHDLWITDWQNARDVPLLQGGFDLDDFVEYVIEFLHIIGYPAHVVAVCQSSVPVLASTALLAEANESIQPLSITLMSGPIDTRCNPTQVNDFARTRSLLWFERNLIETTPPRYAGASRRVYPGFMQLAAFLAMNPSRHLAAYANIFRSLVEGDYYSAAEIEKFYNEYNSVMDLTAEFYLQTIQKVFQEHSLPLGKFKWRNHRVDPAAIQRTALLTIEGRNDDICGMGQTAAAHLLAKSLPSSKRRHHVQPGVSHFEVFSGRLWSTQIYPVLKKFIRENEV